ncbi:hypothetical protein C8R43DRAFT_908320 [Mycena crocata]|nr:hypothetical protein C8R43DRAFT_908320 [Mycena crocata]
MSTSFHSPSPAGMQTILCTGLDVRQRYIILTYGFIINRKLDVNKLKRTLWALIEQKFPRAGARIAHKMGMYEFQIPNNFSKENPPVQFTAVEYAELYRSPARPILPDDLPDGLDLSQPSIHTRPAFDLYFKSRGCPTSFNEFLVPDMPALHTHVTVFNDITFIGFTSSHILLDSLGMQTLLHAWTLILSGESIHNIVGMEWDAAPFDALTNPTAVGPRPGWVIDAPAPTLSKESMGPNFARKLVRMPKSFLRDSTHQINEQLRLQGSSEWVGSSDVLLAWWLKTVYGHQSVDTKLVRTIYPIDIRQKNIFPGPTGVLTTPYINNAFTWVSLPVLSTHLLRKESIADIALIIRRAIITSNRDVDGMAKDVQWKCSNPLAWTTSPPPSEESTVQSNWRKSQFGALDFSGACPEMGIGSSQAPLKCFVDVDMGLGVPAGVVLAEDNDAVWMSQVREVKDWESICQSGTVTFV